MRRDLDPIELPAPMPDYGRPTGDTVIDGGAAGTQPIDNLDLGTDPEHLGAGMDPRGPVPEPPDRDDPEAVARSAEAKSATDSTVSHGEADPSATRTEGMPVDHRDRPLDRDPSA